MERWALGSGFDFDSSTIAKNNIFDGLDEWGDLAPERDSRKPSHKVPATTPPVRSMTPEPTTSVSLGPLTSLSCQELVDKYGFVGTREQSSSIPTRAQPQGSIGEVEAGLKSGLVSDQGCVNGVETGHWANNPNHRAGTKPLTVRDKGVALG